MFGLFKGKEVQKKIGEYGEVSVDITEDLHIEVEARLRVDLIGEAKKLADKTGTPIDNAALAWLERLTRNAAEQKAS